MQKLQRKAANRELSKEDCRLDCSTLTIILTLLGTSDLFLLLRTPD